MNKYSVLNNQIFTQGRYSIVPIRYEDRIAIMNWRNEQIYHLRQVNPLTRKDQENYFNNILSPLFKRENPEQILFSYLEDNKCIGYGGLVHINWADRNAEISFIINTKLEKEHFHKHWGIYLGLIEQVAFKELNFHKIFTYAFDLRPHLYEAIEAVGYIREAILKEHCFLYDEYKNVIIHSKFNNHLSLRRAGINDKKKIFEWVNEKLTRANSFSTDAISFETHSVWYDNKMKDEKAVYFIGEKSDSPIGLIRFDKGEGGLTIVGILIDVQYRGKGLSAELLRKACAEYLKMNTDDIIYAYIKTENIASVKSFTKAGFVFDQSLLIKNTATVRYKLSKNDL